MIDMLLYHNDSALYASFCGPFMFIVCAYFTLFARPIKRRWLAHRASGAMARGTRHCAARCVCVPQEHHGAALAAYLSF